MPSKPVPQDYDRSALRSEVDAKLQRFLASASPDSPPEGGETKRGNSGALRQAISGLAGSATALYSVRGDGALHVGQAAAVCFVGSQGIILLQIFYRIDRNAQVVYEYALCYQRRGQSPVTWTNAKEFYRSNAQRQSEAAPLLQIDMTLARQSAEELLARIQSGRREFRAKGAVLTGDEVEDQIKSLNALDTTFALGVTDARTAPRGSYRAVGVVLEATGLNLRVFRHDPGGWTRATYTLDLNYSRPRGQRRGRRGDIPEYRWLNA